MLKKKGLIGKGVDARKVTSKTAGSAVRKKVRENRGVVEGREVSYKLPKDIPPNVRKAMVKGLRDQGYKVSGGRVTLPKGQYYRKPSKRGIARGETGVRVKPEPNRPGGSAIIVPLDENFERRIREIFAGKNEGELVGFQIHGHNSLNLYDSARLMINDLSKYQIDIARGDIRSITVFKVSDHRAYMRARNEQSRQLERKSRRARERRAERFRRGFRVTR